MRRGAEPGAGDNPVLQPVALNVQFSRLFRLGPGEGRLLFRPENNVRQMMGNTRPQCLDHRLLAGPQAEKCFRLLLRRSDSSQAVSVGAK